MRKHRIAASVLLAIVSVAIACYEGPFAHVNPNDPGSRFVMRLESDRDTVSVADPVAQFTLVSDPPIGAYQPVWRVSIDTLIAHTENGRFTLTDVPESTISVLVTAHFQYSEVSRVLVIRP